MQKARDLHLFKRIKTLPTFFHTKMDSSERYSYRPSLHWNPKVGEYFIKAYGSDHFSRISTALTQPSTYSCIRVNTLKSTTESIIEKLTAILHEAKLRSEIDAASLVGSVKKQAKTFKESNLDTVLDYNGRPLPGFFEDGNSSPVYKCPMPGLENVVLVKGSGPHTVEYGDSPQQPVKEVIVSRKCAEAVLRGAQVFVPGVLACSAHVEKGETVAVSVAVEKHGLDGSLSFGFTRGTVLQGLETDPQYLERNGLYIGQGVTMMSRSGMFRASEGVAVEMTNRIFRLPSFNDVLEGEIFLQNLPSIVTARVLDPQQGERILDMCAAPGGKTTAIAILMMDKGEVIAVDRSHNKVLDIEKLAAEMGLNSIKPYKLDALKAVRQPNGSIGLTPANHKVESVGANIEDSALFEAEKDTTIAVPVNTPNGDLTHTNIVETICNEKVNLGRYLSKAETRKNARRLKNGPGRHHSIGGRVESSKGFEPNSFDRVLLDAPCSALGLRPRLFAAQETVESLRSHGTYQRKMFDQAVQLVRPGGVIVYSTCTINPGENEALVRYALDKYKFLSLAPQHPRIGGRGLVGCCEVLDGKYVEEWLRPGEEELVQRFDPSSPLDTIGFFIAKFSVGMK